MMFRLMSRATRALTCRLGSLGRCSMLLLSFGSYWQLTWLEFSTVVVSPGLEICKLTRFLLCRSLSEFRHNRWLVVTMFMIGVTPLTLERTRESTTIATFCLWSRFTTTLCILIMVLVLSLPAGLLSNRSLGRETNVTVTFSCRPTFSEQLSVPPFLRLVRLIRCKTVGVVEFGRPRQLVITW